jgi:hypothetical protein
MCVNNYTALQQTLRGVTICPRRRYEHRQLWIGWSLLSLNAWAWSSVFHTRDLLWTEKMVRARPQALSARTYTHGRTLYVELGFQSFPAVCAQDYFSATAAIMYQTYAAAVHTGGKTIAARKTMLAAILAGVLSCNARVFNLPAAR